MALPTFVIGGARKSGTTALWAFLAEHPDVWMSRLKEPHFLTRDANEPIEGVRIIGATKARTYERGLEWYESLFEEGSDRVARGEASTSYLVAADTPELVNRHIPGLKMIFVLRNPVERAYSDYWHQVKRGHSVPPFSTILDDEPVLRHLLYTGRYRLHLERHRGALGDARIHIVLFDDLRTNPAPTFRGICRFLGVDEAFQPDFSVEHNPHEEPANQLVQRLIARSTYRRWGFVPSAIRRPARRLRESLRTRNLRRATYPPLEPAMRSRLVDYYSEDIAYVEQLTRRLPAWWGPELGP